MPLLSLPPEIFHQILDSATIARFANVKNHSLADETAARDVIGLRLVNSLFPAVCRS